MIISRWIVIFHMVHMIIFHPEQYFRTKKYFRIPIKYLLNMTIPIIPINITIWYYLNINEISGGGRLPLRRRVLRRGRRFSGAPGACDAGPGDLGAGAKWHVAVGHWGSHGWGNDGESMRIARSGKIGLWCNENSDSVDDITYNISIYIYICTCTTISDIFVPHACSSDVVAALR